MIVSADDLDASVSTVVAALAGVETDGTARAGSLEWDCRQTAEHLGDCLMSYAAQVVTARPEGYVRFLATLEPEATFAEAVDVIDASGRLLAAAVRTAAPTSRGWHPSGRAEPAGFAAMGCIETLIHGEDIALGVGRHLDPPREVCTRVVARLFPDLATELTPVDPWLALRWCAGRLALPDRPQRTSWRWRGAPLDGS